MNPAHPSSRVGVPGAIAEVGDRWGALSGTGGACPGSANFSRSGSQSGNEIQIALMADGFVVYQLAACTADSPPFETLTLTIAPGLNGRPAASGLPSRRVAKSTAPDVGFTLDRPQRGSFGEEVSSQDTLMHRIQRKSPVRVVSARMRHRRPAELAGVALLLRGLVAAAALAEGGR